MQDVVNRQRPVDSGSWLAWRQSGLASISSSFSIFDPFSIHFFSFLFNSFEERPSIGVALL